jgi:hypothetical protein|tara:strand:+ start:2535 stop:2846 length:312 start_codon:yes stop_codon:yes gene_type:complete
MAEAKKGFKARVESEMAASGGDSLSEMKAAFSQEERALEHAIDHTVHTFSASIDVAYNVRSNSQTAHQRPHLTLLLFACAVPLAVSNGNGVARAFSLRSSPVF